MIHAHGHKAPSRDVGRLLITMLLNFLITTIEVIGGILSGSLSLLSDALHNFSDGISIIISYVAIRLSGRPRDMTYTFGLKRAEILAAIINSVALITICVFLFKEAYERLVSPVVVKGNIVAIIAGIGLVANVLGTMLLRGVKDKSMNIRSTYLHLLSDTVSSMAVIIGGICMYLFSIYWIDPILTVLIALYVLKEGFSIIKEATGVLMMRAPDTASLEDIKERLEAIPGIKNIHHVHVWRLSEDRVHFEAHVEVDGDMVVTECTRLGTLIEDMMKRIYGIEHVTLQFESNRCESKALVQS